METSVGGFKHVLHRQQYDEARWIKGFCGGNYAYSNWMSREDLMGCLAHVGYTKVDVYGEAQDHPNGPCLTLAASKK